MRTRGVYLGALGACLALLALGATPARANRALLSKEAVLAGTSPANQIEGACGVAVDSFAKIYVSDYYHGAVDVFGGGGDYQSRLLTGAPPGGPCGLAVSSAGALYANYYHQSVVRLEPNPLTFDEGNSTGVAVDSAGNVYVNDRTYVAVYQPSGAPVLFEGQPLRIGLGSLEDGYGVAVSSFSVTKGMVYVADAADRTVKVYEPAVDPETPSAVIDGAATPQHGFSSLTDAALAVDPTNGHLLVADNLQPGFEHPEAAIDEFNADGTFLSQLAARIIDAEPPGLALNSSGGLYATSGNSEGANVFRFGQYSAAGLEGVAGPAAEEGASAQRAFALGVGESVKASAPASPPVAQSASPHRKKAHKKSKHHRRHRAKWRRAR